MQPGSLSQHPCLFPCREEPARGQQSNVRLPIHSPSFGRGSRKPLGAKAWRAPLGPVGRKAGRVENAGPGDQRGRLCFNSPACIRVHCGRPSNTQGPSKNTITAIITTQATSIWQPSPETRPKIPTWKVWEHLFPMAIISLHSETVIRAHSK